MKNRDLLLECSGFEWDQANAVKNWTRHHVTPSECEQIFFNESLLIEDDPDHSLTENRFYALGRTDGGRLLFAVFTIRNKMIRIISARDMNRKERKVFLA